MGNKNFESLQSINSFLDNAKKNLDDVSTITDDVKVLGIISDIDTDLSKAILILNETLEEMQNLQEKRKIVEATIRTLKNKGLLKEQEDEDYMFKKNITVLKNAIDSIGFPLDKFSFKKSSNHKNVVLATFYNSGDYISVYDLNKLEKATKCKITLRAIEDNIKIIFMF